MSHPQLHDSELHVPATVLRTMQIIALALPAGVIAFAGVAIFLNLNKPAGNMLIPAVAVGFLVLNAAMKFAFQMVFPVPRVARHEPRYVADMCRFYQTRLIIGLALIEGAAFFNLVAYLLEAYWWSLAAAAFALAIMLLDFPTRTKVDTWLTHQADLQQLEHQ